MKVYNFAMEDPWEAEGMFKEDGTLLGAWSMNDGYWRSEYFNGFLAELGIDIVDPPEEMEAEMKKKLREYFGE